MLLIIVCVLILAVNVLIGAGTCTVDIHCENNTIIFSNVFLAHASYQHIFAS